MRGGYAYGNFKLSGKILTFPYDPACGTGGMLLEIVHHVGEQGGDPRLLTLKGQEKNLTTEAIARMNLHLPDISGFSPPNLKSMRKFAASWTDRGIVQRTVAQIPWRSNIALMDKLKDSGQRLWYARMTVENGWSRDILVSRIQSCLYQRTGKATHNFDTALLSADSDMADQIFKDPYVFDSLRIFLNPQFKNMKYFSEF